MPVTQLDTTAALVLIDLQKGIIAVPTTPPASEIVAQSAELARAFRKRGLPVVVVNVTAAAPGRTDAGPRNFAFPTDWTDLIPELDQQPTDYLISKQSPGAFIGTTLHQYLQEQSVTQIFLAGIATSGGVEATARSAFDHGYNVVLITDAMADRSPEAHKYSIEKVLPRMGETDVTHNVLKLLHC